MKDYKRLTKRSFLQAVDVMSGDIIYSGKVKTEPLVPIESCLTRLAELEDKIEQGRLIELPVKVGDTVYSIPFGGNKKIFKHKVKNLRLLFISEAKDCDHIENNFAWFGENIFLTKEEAEAKLKELRGGK